MGITDNLQITLRQNSDKNKQALTKKYEEHSLWLQNELKLIKNLVIQNPREKLGANHVPSSSKQQMSEDLDEIPAPAAPAAMNKRKSPECSFSPSHVKDSPNQKRSALNTGTDDKSEELLDLPTDLRSLTKSQLFSHLHIRGVSNFNFKMKKNELVDLLSLHVAKTAGAINVDDGIQTKCPYGSNEEVLNNTITDENLPEPSTAAVTEASLATQKEPLVNVSSNRAHILKAKSIERDITTKILSQLDIKFSSDQGLQQSEQNQFKDSGTSSTLFSADAAANLNEGNEKLKAMIKVVNINEANLTSSTAVLCPPNKSTLSNTADVPGKKPLNLPNQLSFLHSEKQNKTTITASEQVRLQREKEKAQEKVRIAKLAEESKQKNLSDSNLVISVLPKKPVLSNNTPSTSTKLPNGTGVKLPMTIPAQSGLPSKKGPMNVLNIFNKKSPNETTSNTNVAKLIVETAQFQLETNAEIVKASPSLSQVTNNSAPATSQQIPASVNNPSATETAATTGENKTTPSQLTEPTAPTITGQQSDCEEYQIEDRSSSDDSESGTDDDEEGKRQTQKIPEWARGTQLKEALDRQYGTSGGTPMDPDLIFPEVQTCSLEEIFGANCGKSGKQYSKRTSSAKWDQDELTLIEKRNYRVQMGYGGRA